MEQCPDISSTKRVICDAIGYPVFLRAGEMNRASKYDIREGRLIVYESSMGYQGDLMLVPVEEIMKNKIPNSINFIVGYDD